MIAIGATSQAENSTTGVWIPVWRTKTDKTGYHIDPIGIRHPAGKILSICRITHQPQLIAQPLNGSTAHKYRTFERVVNFAVNAKGDGG